MSVVAGIRARHCRSLAALRASRRVSVIHVLTSSILSVVNGHLGVGRPLPPGFKFQFGRRLDTSWTALADFLDIPAHDADGFPKGEEARRIWAWLDARNRLHELTGALRAIDRHDLADLTERTAGVVITRFDTHPIRGALRDLYHKVIAGAGSPNLEIRDIAQGGGLQPDLRFAAYLAEQIIQDESSRDAVINALLAGEMGIVRIYLVGSAELCASAAANIWKWVSTIDFNGLLPRQVPDEMHLAIALTQSLSKVTVSQQGPISGVLDVGRPATRVGGDLS